MKIHPGSGSVTQEINYELIFYSWVLYEKPDFKGEKVALDEGDIELTNPFGPPEDEPRTQQNGEQENNGEPTHTEPRRFIIGSLRRAVRVRHTHANTGLLKDTHTHTQRFTKGTTNIHAGLLKCLSFDSVVFWP